MRMVIDGNLYIDGELFIRYRTISGGQLDVFVMGELFDISDVEVIIVRDNLKPGDVYIDGSAYCTACTWGITKASRLQRTISGRRL